MIKYQRNNIIFRVSSATAISRFKAIQAQSFLQLARRELDFNDAAKEVVLLEYDRFSHWIFRLERICQAVQDGIVPPSLLGAIVSSFDDEVRVIENVLIAHPEVFDRTATEFTRTIHGYAVRVFSNRIDVSSSFDVYRMFAIIVDTVSDYLQHLLIAMHEYNNNIKKHVAQPFISVANFCLDSASDASRFDPAIIRAKFFMSSGCAPQFTLKNYAQQDVFDAAAHAFAQCNIKLEQEETEPEKE